MKGHQTVVNPIIQMNQKMDEKANKMRKDNELKGVPQHYPSIKASLYQHNKLVHANHQDHIIYEDANEQCMEYLKKKHGWNEQLRSMVDWEAHADALKKSKCTSHMTICKILH